MIDPRAAVSRPSHVPAELVVDVDYNHLPGSETDFYGAWKALQANAPGGLIWSPRNGGHWIAMSGRLVKAIYRDFERFSSRILIPPREVGEKFNSLPISLDPPDNRPYRNILNSALGPKAVNKIADKLRKHARDLIEAVAPEGQCDYVEYYAQVFPYQTIMELAELPVSDAPYVRNIVTRSFIPDETMSQEEAFAALSNYFAPLVEARRGSDGIDLISQIANGVVDGRLLTTVEAVKMCFATVGAGLGTVVRALGHIMLYLATHPKQRRQLREDPELKPDAMSELLRVFSAIALSREVVADMTYEGVEMKRGDIVTMPTQFAGWDERENPNAFEIDFSRKRPFEATFGSGPHVCAGRNLGRLELRISLEEWLARIPEFSLQEGAEIRYMPGPEGAIASLPLRW